MNKEKLLLILKSAPLEVSVDITLDFLDRHSIIDLLDYDDDLFNMFIEAIDRPSKHKGLRDMTVFVTEILTSVRDMRTRTKKLADEALVSMEKLNQTTNLVKETV